MIPKISQDDMLDTHASLWQEFFKRENLTPEQGEQFKQYYKLLVRTNDIHNLTAITDIKKVITHHFEDSLALAKFIDLNQISMIADVGTGAGFPALPLKIVYPHLKVVLIEVNHKKREFLAAVRYLLKLEDVEINELDWRTFLRKTEYPIDLFCARASLSMDELVRMFKPLSPYKNAMLVYWASQYWVPEEEVAPFVEREERYSVNHKKRKLVFLKNNPQVLMHG